MTALEEIIELNASISESILSTLVYHKNNELRKRARIAQIHLSQHDPFKFFSEEFDKDFTAWDKIKIHDILLKKPLKTIPNFARWIPVIKNEKLQCLFIYEIGHYKQIENRHFLFDYFKKTTNDMVKIECLKTLEILGISEFKTKFLHIYPLCSEEVQLHLTLALKKVANDPETLKFFIKAFDKTYETNLKIALGKAIYNSGPVGKKAISVIEKNAEGFDLLVFEHVKNPLLEI